MAYIAKHVYGDDVVKEEKVKKPKKEDDEEEEKNETQLAGANKSMILYWVM